MDDRVMPGFCVDCVGELDNVAESISSSLKWGDDSFAHFSELVGEMLEVTSAIYVPTAYWF